MRVALSAMLFSSSVGMNSVPSRVNKAPATTSNSRAPPTNAKGALTAAPSTGR